MASARLGVLDGEGWPEARRHRFLDASAADDFFLDSVDGGFGAGLPFLNTGGREQDMHVPSHLLAAPNLDDDLKGLAMALGSGDHCLDVMLEMFEAAPPTQQHQQHQQQPHGVMPPGEQQAARQQPQPQQQQAQHVHHQEKQQDSMENRFNLLSRGAASSGPPLSWGSCSTTSTAAHMPAQSSLTAPQLQLIDVLRRQQQHCSADWATLPAAPQDHHLNAFAAAPPPGEFGRGGTATHRQSYQSLQASSATSAITHLGMCSGSAPDAGRLLATDSWRTGPDSAAPPLMQLPSVPQPQMLPQQLSLQRLSLQQTLLPPLPLRTTTQTARELPHGSLPTVLLGGGVHAFGAASDVRRAAADAAVRAGVRGNNGTAAARGVAAAVVDAESLMADWMHASAPVNWNPPLPGSLAAAGGADAMHGNACFGGPGLPYNVDVRYVSAPSLAMTRPACFDDAFDAASKLAAAASQASAAASRVAADIAAAAAGAAATAPGRSSSSNFQMASLAAVQPMVVCGDGMDAWGPAAATARGVASHPADSGSVRGEDDSGWSPFVAVPGATRMENGMLGRDASGTTTAPLQVLPYDGDWERNPNDQRLAMSDPQLAWCHSGNTRGCPDDFSAAAPGCRAVDSSTLSLLPSAPLGGNGHGARLSSFGGGGGSAIPGAANSGPVWVQRTWNECQPPRVPSPAAPAMHSAGLPSLTDSSFVSLDGRTAPVRAENGSGVAPKIEPAAYGLLGFHRASDPTGIKRRAATSGSACPVDAADQAGEADAAPGAQAATGAAAGRRPSLRPSSRTMARVSRHGAPHGGSLADAGSSKLLLLADGPEGGESGGVEEGEWEDMEGALADRGGRKPRVPQALITRTALQQHFHRPIKLAARHLGASLSCLKKVCRRLGVPRWPCRKLACLCKMRDTLRADVAGGAIDKQELLTLVLRNIKEIYDNPDAPMYECFSRLRQNQYKNRNRSSGAVPGGQSAGAGRSAQRRQVDGGDSDTSESDDSVGSGYD